MLLRSILECSATASWLACPDESIEEHIRRSDDLRARDFKDQLDFFLSAAKNPRAPLVPDDTMEVLRSRGTDHRNAGRSARRIDYLRLAGSQFDAEAAYRVLSGRSHGRPWARDALQDIWVNAFRGDTSALEREAIGNFARAMEWFCWGARDYCLYVCPALLGHVDNIMKRWGTRSRLNS